MTTEDDKTNTTFPPPIETETLQYRLITGNISKFGGQRGSLTRCAQKFGALTSKMKRKNGSVDEEDLENEIETIKQELTSELELYKLEMTKLILMQQTLENQVQVNETIQNENVKEIESLSNQVVESQGVANRWQEIQNCYQEYESLAQLANTQHPKSSRVLREEIAQIENELATLERQDEAANKLLRVRESQFQLLVQYMLDLKRTLEEDDEEAIITKGVDAIVDEQGGSEEKDSDKPAPMELESVDDGLYNDLL